jgi:hypothetical protein
MSTRVVDGYRSPAADAFISFGIKGDLARVMTLRSLYRLSHADCLTGR